MRDIPMFTTASGIASLYFKKIPFTKEAFVEIRVSNSLEELVKECIDVCRMAGAERIFATGHAVMQQYPLFCTVSKYCVSKDILSNTEAFALPLTESQAYWWRRVYNQKMRNVPTAVPLSESDVEALIRKKHAYCVYKDFDAIGIGVAYDGQIQAVASAAPGGGHDSVLALSNVLESDVISLYVASTNIKAIELYRSLGFTEAEQQMCWYQIF